MCTAVRLRFRLKERHTVVGKTPHVPFCKPGLPPESKPRLHPFSLRGPEGGTRIAVNAFLRAASLSEETRAIVTKVIKR